MAENNSFDFESFSVQAIQAIDEIRSFGKDSAQTPIESRINAFYRALGLPAAVKENTKQPNKNNGNVFSPNTIKYSDYDGFFASRYRFKTPILPEEIQNFIKFNTNKVSAGITGERKRGPLFPMIVDGEQPIFPQNRRVAVAFSTEEELLIGEIKYKRPLIETIIFMRLNIEGVQNTIQQEEANSNLKVSNTDIFSTLVFQAFSKSTNGIDELLLETINKSNRAKGKTDINVTPIIANIAQQSLAREDPVKPAELDTKIAMQEEQQRIQQTLLSALQFDDTFAGDIKNSRNVKDALLASNLMSIINSGSAQEKTKKQNKEEQDRKETIEKREKSVAITKEAFRTFDLLFGTFGGISGVDMLVIFRALFEIDRNNLLGLLNDKAIENLKAIKGENIADNKWEINAAINELQNKVTEIYAEIEKNIERTKWEDKKSKQKKEAGEV